MATLRPSRHASVAASSLAALCFVCLACEDEGSATPPDAGNNEPMPTDDAASNAPDGALPDEPDGSEPDPSPEPDAGGDPPLPDAGPNVSDSGPDQPSPCDLCASPTPACVNDRCVECSSEDGSECAANESCDIVTHTCVADSFDPFQLDCARLPQLPGSAPCHGGPREVLLATHESGALALFDPQDGHFLGYLKSHVETFNSDNEFWLATQGPDQCIWTVNSGERGIERWDTQGNWIDTIIPRGRYFVEGTQDVIDEPRSIAFTEDKVYVASTSYPSERVSRFSLTGSPEELQADLEEVVLDDGTMVTSLLALRDGSLLISDHYGDALRLILPTGGAGETVYGGLVPAQLGYAGGGKVLVPDWELGGELHLVDLATGAADHIRPYLLAEQKFISTNHRGAAMLGNGNWMFTSGDAHVGVLDPLSTNPTGQFTIEFDDPHVNFAGNFNYIGRACVPQSVLDDQVPDPPVPSSSCNEPAGPALLDVDFESGDFTGTGTDRNYQNFFVQTSDSIVSLDATGADGSGRSLKIETPTGGTWYSGVHRELDNLQPSYIGYWLRVSSNQPIIGYFALRIPDATIYDDEFEVILTGEGVLYTIGSRFEKPIGTEWLRVQLRDIDWEKRTFDLYVNCERVGDDLWFVPNGADQLGSIDLFNYRAGTSWFDEIVMK